MTKPESMNSHMKEPAHHQGQENITNGATVAKHCSVNGNVKEPVHYQGQKNITNGAGSLNGNVKELVLITFQIHKWYSPWTFPNLI